MTVPEAYVPGGAESMAATALTGLMMTVRYSPEEGWASAQIGPRRPLALDPACVVLHYGQAVFEGLRAHRHASGGWALFRARDYALRLGASCERLAIPPLPIERCLALWREFVSATADELAPQQDSIYLRTLIIGTDVFFGSRPSQSFLAVVLGSADPLITVPDRSLEVLITDRFVRAAPGGMGSAKTPGNYAAGMLAHKVALEHGCDQVLWLDAGRRRWVEELGSLNVMFVLDDVLVTPPLSETILAGVTRDTILTLARDNDITIEERPVALEEITAAFAWQGLKEAFACSSAAGVRSIGAFHLGERRIALPQERPIAERLQRLLQALQRGQTPDRYGWLAAV